ncbi:MAG: hypothetical protein Q8P40_14135 [Nitrospirota bacterium]|nr:hypothetical protein [Nitrospirota bacterium]
MDRLFPKMIRPLKFQRLLWKESIQAVKDSIKFSSFDSFRSFLEDNLPQSSSYTRKRYTRSILKWFFQDKKLYSLPSLVWKHYQDESILRDVMRYEYLSKEPIISEFILEYLLPLKPGIKISTDYFKNFIIKKFGEAKKDPINFLSLACRDLGFIKRNRNIPVVQGISEPKTAFLILIHHIFAPRQRTIPIKEIVEHPFWLLLGIRGQEKVRLILKEADAKGIIAKYIVADQLEQITTKYSTRDFIENRFKL